MPKITKQASVNIAVDISQEYMLQQSPVVHKHRIADCLESISASLVNTISKALEVGARLTAVKSSLPHGEFTDWCIDNFPDR